MLFSFWALGGNDYFNFGELVIKTDNSQELKNVPNFGFGSKYYFNQKQICMMACAIKWRPKMVNPV